MSKPKAPGPNGPPSRIPLAQLRTRAGRTFSEEEPAPLGPPPSVEGMERLEEPGIFEETSKGDRHFATLLKQAELDAMAFAGDDEPTGLIRARADDPGMPRPPPTSARRASPPPPPPGSPPTAPRRARRSAVDTDWPEPPSLPEPPERFAPPEMTIPPRAPEASAVHGGTLPPVPSTTSGLIFAEELGTPELPDLTPSDLPNALEQRLRAHSSQVSGVDHSDVGLGVVSQVVDMPLGVMRPGDAEAPARVAFYRGNSLPEEGSSEVEFPTAIWSTDAPPVVPHKAPLSTEEKPPAAEGIASGDSFAGITPATAGGRLIAGRYRVIERVGQGGMARIFRVKHVELGKDFALKIIHSAFSGDAKVREMFYQEARLASSLDHPNIVLLTDFGVDDRFGAFIVMEYLKGETLFARLRREGTLHQNVACEIALQVAEALHFIHGKNVVHCDIKSENIFLCEPPAEQRRRVVVKLLDFGLSRPKIGSGRVSMSEVGGTPAYMAPERINRMAPRPSMDIYSLGILLYEMLTGSLPFSGTVEETLLAQLKDPPPPLAARTKDPPDDRLEALIMRALRKDPEERQKDMAALVYEMRTVMDMLGLGRRRGGRPAVAPRAQAPARARDSEVLVAECPLPLFLMDPQGTLLLGNPAFASFVNLASEQLAGTPLADTRLGRICPEIMDDLKTALETRKPTQRLLSFPWRSLRRVSMMIWLVPQCTDQEIQSIVGAVHPFSNTPATAP